ncbi:fatty acyl-CoA reductase wat [Microplitis demolitor]|uniref:fatty acyl-CoA reductase wat n=1 Tax=Microplitis demolitor TaxID=69319 RepID=UPI0004CCDC96|nr:fatty acyl-CoA reductase wat [Microplitis demolitor]
MLLENQVSRYGNEGIDVYENDINENNNNIMNTINMEQVITRTPIQDFYAGRNIFITGATGFLGKTMIEKLLRICPEVSTIYILIRPKKKSNIIDRVEDIFNEPIFEQLKNDSPKLRHKIVAIPGDCTFPDLGLTLEDRKKIIDEVSVVFHNAATVKFDEKLKVATTINAGGTLAVINLCKEIKNLKAMIHVSTAYANCHLDTIDEQFYPHPLKYDDLRVIVNSLPDETVNAILPKLLEKWPNTYTYTKALAENVVREKSQDLPIGIFRPAIIISCADDPLPGWIDNYYGPMGVAAAAAVGFLRSIRINRDVYANMVPVDYTVNAILASAWDVATQPDKRGENMLIYNYISTVENPITWGFYIDNCLTYGRDFPLKQSVWYLTMSTYQNKTINFFANIILHLLPALLVDIVAVCTGHKPRVVKSISKINRFLNVIQPFSLKNWNFKNDNIQRLWLRLDSKDKLSLKFTFDKFDWKHYLRNHMLGVRLYLFKEDMSTLESARKRLQRLRWIHETVKIAVGFFVIMFIWKLFNIIF